MTARPATLEAALAEVHYRHRAIVGIDHIECACDDVDAIWSDDERPAMQHAAHVAAVLADTVRKWETGRLSRALEQVADQIDSVGHHWSGAPGVAFFALASTVRDRAASFHPRAALHGTEAGERA